MGRDNKSQIIRDAILRFPEFGNRTIARYILDTDGLVFDNDLEKIRNRVRVARGKSGEHNRAHLANKSLFGDTPHYIPKSWKKTRTPYKLSQGLWLILSDLHVPYHEELPIESAVKYGQIQKVDGILINGDLQDCASIGYWTTNRRDFDEEFRETLDMLNWLRGEFPAEKFVYKPGNHEYRLPTFYAKKAPELMRSPVAAMESQLGLEARNIEFLDYHQKVMAGELPIIHGHEVRNLQTMVNPARGLFLKTKTFSACSHCHRTSEHSTRDINELMLTTWSFGCLCNLEPDYNPIGNEWNWGFALVGVENSGFFEVENRRILSNGKVV